MAQRNTLQTNLWLRHQMEIGSTAWYRQCLSLTRSARNIPPLYPSAISAAFATPSRYRVYKTENVRRGMVFYVDDPHDSNPYGHVVTIQGRDRRNYLWCWTNDVAGRGRVSLTPLRYFPEHWGDRYLFGATWLNGVVLDMPDLRRATAKVTVAQPEEPEPTIQGAIDRLTKVIDKGAEEDRILKALERDRDFLHQLQRR